MASNTVFGEAQGVRQLTFTPQRGSDIGKDLSEGWSQVRLLIDQSGTVTGALILKLSEPQFRPTSEAIVASLRSSGAAADVVGAKGTTVNAFFINVLDGAQVHVSQFAGH